MAAVSVKRSIVRNFTSREAVSGAWKILNYYEPVLLQNITNRSCYYLFITEAEMFAGTHKKPLFRLKRTGACFRNNLFTSIKTMMIDSQRLANLNGGKTAARCLGKQSADW